MIPDPGLPSRPPQNSVQESGWGWPDPSRSLTSVRSSSQPRHHPPTPHARPRPENMREGLWTCRILGPSRRFPHPAETRRRDEGGVGKPGPLQIADLLAEVPSPRGQGPVGLLTRDGSRIPNPGPGVRARGRAIPGQAACRSVGTGSEAAAWPGSSARGGHELVTSLNLVDPGRVEGLTRRPGRAGA